MTLLLFADLLNHCKSWRQFKQIQALITTSGLSDDNYLVSKLLFFSAISDSRDLHYSSKLFLTLSKPNTFVYNTIIRGFSISKNPNPAISLYVQMMRTGIAPDHLTYPFLAKSCASLSEFQLGSSVHCSVVKSGFESDLFVQNSFIHMYASCFDLVSARNVFDGMTARNLVSWNSMVDACAKCGDLVTARDAFDQMPERDVISWSALIDGCVKGGEYRDALALFDQMSDNRLKPNTITMVSVFCACAHLGALARGRKMHHCLKDSGLYLSLELLTSLVDMYAKCGSITEALEVFREVPPIKTDVLIWNAVIGGLATHGLCKESLEMFREMQMLGVRPDEVTYLCLLSACAHGGLVEEARGFFESLRSQGMSPQVEHYACMVDVLGRSGHVGEAYELVRTLPMEPSSSVLGALLTACRVHGQVQLGEIVGKMLIEVDPDHDGRYIGLFSIYAVAQRWGDAKVTREAMEKRGVKKAAGYSEIEVDGTLHRFIAHDKFHWQSNEIYFMLSLILSQMKFEFNISCDEQFMYENEDDGMDRKD